MIYITNFDGKIDWPHTSPYNRREARLARLDIRESERVMEQPIRNGHRVMGPPATRYHHNLCINRMLVRVILILILLLRHLFVLLELVVGEMLDNVSRFSRSISYSALALLYEAVWARP